VIEVTVMSIHEPAILLLLKQILDNVTRPINVAASSVKIF